MPVCGKAGRPPLLMDMAMAVRCVRGPVIRRPMATANTSARASVPPLVMTTRTSKARRTGAEKNLVRDIDGHGPRSGETDSTGGSVSWTCSVPKWGRPNWAIWAIIEPIDPNGRSHRDYSRQQKASPGKLSDAGNRLALVARPPQTVQPLGRCCSNRIWRVRGSAQRLRIKTDLSSHAKPANLLSGVVLR